MEKRTPHYDLARIQAEVMKLGVAAFTKAALDGGRTIGPYIGGNADSHRPVIAPRILQVDDDVFRSSHMAGRLSRTDAGSESCLYQNHLAGHRSGDPIQGDLTHGTALFELRRPEWPHALRK
jgi:hypothetical protein